ncbi:hypothetical protein DFH07DRAFT_822596 [Mycena maculata]|uniref:Uncharacterized protein n=1 Tax=Mycena maculata TaxID=230809 RepID=A0AAD7J1J3_9AGAR|nr:hypothetical protein DFH07DRAFT_822596 [Mycena maculata]
MSGFEAGQGSPSYYPTALYQESVFSAKPPPLPVTGDGSSQPECSVRGCVNPVEPPNPNTPGNRKMCAACREKHRAYASTKRARRKAEKNLVNRMSGNADQGAQGVTWVNQESAEQTAATAVTQYESTLSASVPQQSQPVSWSPAIDPALYSQPTGPNSNSSSTLAGALTLQPSTNSLPTVSTGQAAPFSMRDEEACSPNAQSDSRDGQSELQLGDPPGMDASGSGSDPTALGTAPNDRPRFCSVKGCKALILESMEIYPYKMCQPCRNRYRNYGITKRAKWKAEREAYDRELEGLRAKEDIRRAANGLPSLSDSPEELRAFELSIIDEQVPLPPTHQSSVRGPVSMPMDLLDTRYSRQVPSDILPGFYRYKRCETHRIQNRWHSKLKRGREKIEKGFMLPDGTPLVAPGPIKTKSNAEPKEKKTRKKREVKGQDLTGTEGASGPSTLGESEGGEGTNTEQSPDNDKPAEKRRSKSLYTCRVDDCCNLIAPGTRWRTCDICRSHKRTERQEKKSIEKLQSGGFVNITVDTPILLASGPDSASGSGSSTAVVPMDVSTTGPSAPEHTSTSTLLTVDEPPPDKPRANPGGVRLVRKYRKLPRYDKEPNGTSSTTTGASSSRTPAAAASTHTAGPHPSAYPYPSPPGAYPYTYMAPPGYYEMPPPTGSSAQGQPPLMYIPSPYPYAMMPSPDKAGSARSGTPVPAPVPYPYYPYALPPPGYGAPQHYPRAQYTPYTYPNVSPIPGNATPYAMYKFHSTPPVPPPPSTNNANQGYTYYQFKNGLKNPEEQPLKRRRLSEEHTAQEPGQQHVFRITPLKDNVAAAPTPAPPVNAPVTPEPVAAQPVPMVVDNRDEEQRPTPPPKSRLCGSKTCNRVLTSAASGLCEKCRMKMKKRQALTKQRFRLEPKKIAAMTGTVSLVNTGEVMEQ